MIGMGYPAEYAALPNVIGFIFNLSSLVINIEGRRSSRLQIPVFLAAIRGC